MLGNRLLSGAFKNFLAERCPGYKIGEFPALKDVPVSKDMRAGMQSGLIIADYFSLSRAGKNLEGRRVVLLDEGLEKEITAALFAAGRIVGVVRPDSDIDAFMKAVELAGRGEIWMDDSTLKMLISGGRTARNLPEFSRREAAVIDLLKQGRRNKEIASALSISEQTVKSHFNRIFRKMKVSGRTELLSRLNGAWPRPDQAGAS